MAGARRGPTNPWSGARLPIADGPTSKEPCDRDPAHVGGIRFDLYRYNRKVGQVLLCGPCFMALNPRAPVDPLDVTEAA